MATASRLRGFLLAALFGVWSLALVGASCDKKSAARPSDVADPQDPAGGDPGAPAAQAEDLPGVSLAGMSEPQKSRFFRAIDKLQSACGKPHSLRTSLKTDPGCKRSVFAARYVVRLVKEDLLQSEIEKRYQDRYQAEKRYEFDLRDTPYDGAPNAPVVLVEFFDYGCPHCRAMMPLLEDLHAEFPSDLVIYYKHFPLSSHPDSVPAAMAAVSAQRQGKFREMHRKLFQHQNDHSLPSIYKYAKEIGLDMTRFDADMKNPATRKKVEADRAEGENADLRGTPTLYLNGRTFSDDYTFEDLKEWVAEELTVR